MQSAELMGKSALSEFAAAIFRFELGVFSGAAVSYFFCMSFSINIHFINPSS